MSIQTAKAMDSLHQMGYAFDFNGPQANMDAFADFIKNNLSPQTLHLLALASHQRAA